MPGGDWGTHAGGPAGGTPGGFRLDHVSLEVPAEILEDLNLSKEALDQIASKLPEQLQTVQAMLS